MHSVFANGFTPLDSELIDAAVIFALAPQCGVNLLGIQFDLWRRCCCARCRSTGEGERVMKSFRKLGGIPVTSDVHIHDPWRFMQHVIVHGRDLQSGFLDLRHHWCHFVLSEHEIAHGHRLAMADLFEGDPTA